MPRSGMIDQARLEEVLRTRLAGFDRLVSCERLSAGASRETYRLIADYNGRETELALRRAEGEGRSALGFGPGLDIEAKLFAAARAAGVPGPEVFLVLQPADQLGAGFVMEWIKGETLGGKITRSPDFAEARKTLAFQCGEILARLHKTDVAASGLDTALESFEAEHSVRKTHASYLELETSVPMIDFTLRWLLANLPKPRPLALTHSDFRNGNLIVDPSKGVVAVLDWELAHIGDPMRDLGWLCTRSWRFGVPGKPVGGFGEYEELFAGYESISGEKVDREAVRFWEVFGSFWWAIGTLSMAHSYRTGMNTSVERPAIGRRTSECQIDLINMLIPGKARVPQEYDYTLMEDLPTTAELLESVRDFLRDDLKGVLEGRNAFLARVASNSVDTVVRELKLVADIRHHELASLVKLTNSPEPHRAMKDDLCLAIRHGEMDIASPELQQYLRDSVLAQAMIDQPDYAGTAEALKNAKGENAAATIG